MSWSCTDQVQSEYWLLLVVDFSTVSILVCFALSYTHNMGNGLVRKVEIQCSLFLREKNLSGSQRTFLCNFMLCLLLLQCQPHNAGFSVLARAHERRCFDFRRATMPSVPLQHQTFTPALSFKLILHRHLLRSHQDFQSRIRPLLSFAS